MQVDHCGARQATLPDSVHWSTMVRSDKEKTASRSNPARPATLKLADLLDEARWSAPVAWWPEDPGYVG